MMATHEYENMKEQLDLEQSLRQKSETYAHEVRDKTHLNSLHQYNLSPCSDKLTRWPQNPT